MPKRKPSVQRVRPEFETFEDRICPSAGPGVNLSIPGPIFAGDDVTITATLNTEDPNENGEGEPLVIQSSGGFSATIGDYAVTQQLSFTATQDGETLDASIQGYDGDE